MSRHLKIKVFWDDHFLLFVGIQVFQVDPVQHTFDGSTLLQVLVGGCRSHSQDIGGVVTAAKDCQINEQLVVYFQLRQHLGVLNFHYRVLFGVKAAQLDGGAVDQAVHVVGGRGVSEALLHKLGTLGLGFRGSLEHATAHERKEGFRIFDHVWSDSY